MRYLLALLVISRVAVAAPEPLDIGLARHWVAAMHDHDFAAAAAMTHAPLQFDAASLAKTDDVAKAFGDEAKKKESYFRKPKWKSAANIERVAQREVAKEAMVDEAHAVAVQMSSEHHFVRITLREPTSDSSWRFITYLIAEVPVKDGFAIDLIATGAEALAN